MDNNSSFWQRMGLHDWFLKKEAIATTYEPPPLTPDDVYHFIIEKFEESISKLSFANRIVFYHEYIVCFNPEDYKEFMENKKGIFGLIILECVKKFYQILKDYRKKGKTVEPASNKWVFRFVSHPEYGRGDKSLIGKLMPGSNQPKEENLRITFIPRQTGIAETFDINPDIMEGFNFYSEGYYEVPYQEELEVDENKITQSETNVLARFETFVPDKEYAGKKIEYLMKNDDIIISGKDEPDDAPNVFRIPSDWVNSPHLRIRYNKDDSKFYMTSFGEKTILNELGVPTSDINEPLWVELPVNSRIVLNGIIGLNIFKS